MRVAGAQFLAALGLDIFLIQALGRWESKMVLRYIADSPMATMTALLQDKLKCRSIEQLRLSAHG